MSEIPKLRVIRPSDKSTTRFEEFLCEDNLQEVNTFWDKYKNNEKLFMRDYPKEYEYYLEYLLLNRCNIHNDLNWYDWLHDYLYKVEL